MKLEKEKEIKRREIVKGKVGSRPKKE